MADCIISINDGDFIGLASGTGNPQQVKYFKIIISDSL
jgi:hypothetical protein